MGLQWAESKGWMASIWRSDQVHVPWPEVETIPIRAVRQL